MKRTLAFSLWSLVLGNAALSLAETGVYLAAKGAKIPPAPAVVSLKVVPAPGIAPVARFPVSTGVPFADGHPTDGITVPLGFNWDWVMTVPHKVADAHRRAWIDAGCKWSATPSVQLAAEKVGNRGWPTGWLRANPAAKTAVQYTMMPDLRIRECRTC